MECVQIGRRNISGQSGKSGTAKQIRDSNTIPTIRENSTFEKIVTTQVLMERR